MQDIFYEYRVVILFLHVISAVVWIGGMVAMKYAAHPSFMEITSPIERLERISFALKRLFLIVFIFILILAGTGAFLTIGYGIKYTDFHIYTRIKEAIWGLMFLNYGAMVIRRSKVDKAIAQGDLVYAKNNLIIIGKYMVPINILLGVSAIFIGAYLSGNL